MKNKAQPLSKFVKNFQALWTNILVYQARTMLIILAVPIFKYIINKQIVDIISTVIGYQLKNCIRMTVALSVPHLNPEIFTSIKV